MAADDYDDDDTPEPAEKPRPQRPQAKTSTLTIVLAFLNLLALPAFLYLLLASYQARTNWAYQTFLHHVYVWGLPLEEEEQGSLSQDSRPKVELAGSRVKDAFNKRRPAGTQVKGSEEFQNVSEPVPIRIRPSDLPPFVQQHVFAGIGDPVATLEQEVNRLKQRLPAALEEKASEAVAKVGNNEAQKRQALEAVLLPLAWNAKQVDALKKRIDATPAGELDALLRDAVQRRVLVDVLAPVNVMQPGDLEKETIEKAADLENVTLDQLKGLLQQRLDAAISGTNVGEVRLGKQLDGTPRDTLDKREDVAQLLFVLGQVKVPLTNDWLLPNQAERAQVVVGLYEYAHAAGDYVAALGELNERVLNNIRADREGYAVDYKGALVRAGGFLREHDAEVQRLRKLVADLGFSEKRLQDLQQQRDEYQKEYANRLEHLKVVTARLTDARQATAKTLQELQELQQELYRAQVELSDAAERNNRLAAQIRAAEGLKEGK